MRIADIDIPEAHSAGEIVTNTIYWIVAMAVAGAAGMTRAPAVMVLGGLVAYALVQQGAGSIAYHATRDGVLWSQLLDAISIQWVMGALVGLSLYAAYDVTPYVLVPLVLGAWAWWWRHGDHVRRNPAIALQALIVVGLMWGSVGWQWTLFCLALILLAVALQMGTAVHSKWHSLWHVLAGLAQGMAGCLLALHAGGIDVPFPL